MKLKVKKILMELKWIDCIYINFKIASTHEYCDLQTALGNQLSLWAEVPLYLKGRAK